MESGDGYSPWIVHEGVTVLSGRLVIIGAMLLTLISGWLVLSVLLAAVWSIVGRRIGTLNREHDGEWNGAASAARTPGLQAAAR